MNLKGALHKDNYATDGKSGDEDGSDICEEDDENREAMRPHKVWVSKNVWLKMTKGWSEMRHQQWLPWCRRKGLGFT
ncbi:unnamed protein product [Malus baccata var. baccata]